MMIDPLGATTLGGPRKFRQSVFLAYKCARERRPFADAEAMAGPIGDDDDPAHFPIRWSAGPAGMRASMVLDASMRDTYRKGQIEVAREAIKHCVGDNFDTDDRDRWVRDSLIEKCAIAAARATAAKDGDLSTLILPADIVSAIGELIQIERPMHAERVAADALRDFHVGWSDTTLEDDEEVRESVAEVEAHFAVDAILADMPDNGNLAAALCNAIPDLLYSSAEQIAARTLKRHAESPNRKLIGDTSLNPFAAEWVEPDARDFELHRKAAEILLRQSVPRMRRYAQFAGHQALAASLLRIVNGMEPEPELVTVQYPEIPRIEFDLEAEPGLLGEIARWTQTFAYRAIREFAQPAALAVLAAIFGRRWATPTGLGLNLFLVGVAKTGVGKDAFIQAPRQLLEAAGLREVLAPGDMASDAAVEKALRQRPALLSSPDEFGKMVAAVMNPKVNQHLRAVGKALLETYGLSSPGSLWQGKMRAGEGFDGLPEVYSPTLTIAAATTPESFFGGLEEASLSDGFLNRLTVVRAGKPGERNRDPARSIPPACLLDAIQAADAASKPGNLAAIGKPKFRFARWAEPAAEAAFVALEDWQDCAEADDREGQSNRVAGQALKIATLRALARDPVDPAVTVEDMAWAADFALRSVEALEAGVRQYMAGSDFEALRKAVMRAISGKGTNGVPRSKILAAKGVSKAEPRQVDAALAWLVDAKHVTKLGQTYTAR